MGKLAYEELILLDNFIYLEWDAKEDELLIDVVYKLLSNENFPENIKIMGECVIQLPKSEWINILKQIINKPNLQNLKIKHVKSHENNTESVCFVDKEDNATVVFRGTVTTNEWEDNGKGAYEYDTQEQIEALNYIENLEFDNITVTGHSKGGNKAQYTTILSPKISECISVNGQGFSNEFINKYNIVIDEKKSKITSINAKYDYVNCLFNSISGKKYYIKTEIQINPFDYHKANILLNGNGNLREETNEAEFSKIINNFSEAIISKLPKDVKYLIINNIIDLVELILCKSKGKNDILNVAEEVLMEFSNENKAKYVDIFHIVYPIFGILILPLLFLDDFINMEEGNSKDIVIRTINSVYLLGEEMMKKLKAINEGQINFIKDLLKSINNLIYDLKYEILYHNY